MMKASAKRRRSKYQILEDKAKEARQKAEIEEKMAMFKTMQQQMADMQQQIQQNQGMVGEVQKLFDEGLIKVDPQGQYQVVTDQEERQSISHQASAQKEQEQPLGSSLVHSSMNPQNEVIESTSKPNVTMF